MAGWGVVPRAGTRVHRLERTVKESPPSLGGGQEGASGHQEGDRHPGRGQGPRPVPGKVTSGQPW